MRLTGGSRAGRTGGVHFGRYELQGLLGAGASGSVYLGWDPDSRTRVAVKVLTGWADDPRLRRRLENEAELMRRVDDPHCVRVMDVVEQPPDLGVVMSYVESVTLREVLDKSGALTGVQALGVLRGALQGLIAVHAEGLVHGDVKPANIVVDRRGDALLIDFGLARPAGSQSGSRPEGSPAYMSPEQIRGDTADARSDVYASGAVLFELLTHRRPYQAASVEAVLRSHLEDPVPDPREVDGRIGEQLAEVCMTAMAKRPEDRYPTARAFLEALEDAARERYGAAWLSGAGLGAAAGALIAGELPAGTRSARGRRRATVMVSALVAVLIVAAIVLLLTRSGTHHARPVAARVPPHGTLAAPGQAPCAVRELGRLLPPPAGGDVLRSTAVFDLCQFISAYSLHPVRDRSAMEAAGFRCGFHRFAQSPVRGETVYLYQLKDTASAAALQRFFRNEPSPQGLGSFAVPSVPGATGDVQREQVGTAPAFYEYDVEFPCRQFLVQAGYGYSTANPADAAEAIKLAAATRVSLSC
jgi:Protein kinase domain